MIVCKCITNIRTATKTACGKKAKGAVFTTSHPIVAHNRQLTATARQNIGMGIADQGSVAMIVSCSSPVKLRKFTKLGNSKYPSNKNVENSDSTVIT